MASQILPFGLDLNNMGIIARQSIISTILLYAGAIIGYVNILYLFPKFMDTGQIGIARTLQDMAALFVPIAQFGLTHAFIRFFPQKRISEEDKKNLFGAVLVLALFCFLLFLGAFYLFEDVILSYFQAEAKDFLPYLPHVLLITFLLVIYNLLVSFSQSLLKIIAPNVIKDIIFRLLLSLSLLFYFLRWIDFDQFINALILCYASMTLAILIYLKLKNSLQVGFSFQFMKSGIWKQLMVFALFSLLGTSGMLIIGKVDSMMITGMLGLNLNGIYTTVFYLAVVIEFPKRAINQISLPLVSRAFDREDHSEIERLYKQTSINQLILGSILLIGIWANLEAIFKLMPKGDEFAIGYYVVVFIGIGRLFDMVAGINSEIIVMSKHYRFNMILLSILALFTVLFNLWLIPNYGIVGAAIGSALALILFNLSKLIFLFVKLKIQPFSKNTLVVLSLSALTLWVGLSLPSLNNPLVDILYRSTLLSILFGIGIIWLKPSEEINQLLSDTWRKLFKKH